jgi:tRNA(Ile)-lysidine synthase
VELFFLRLLRGAGGDGLAGMKWKAPSPADRRIVLVRPLLDQPKEVLQEIARRNKIEFSDDATNACVDIQRNRIRHELIPLLRSHYQPALGRVIARLMDVIGAEAEFAAEAARRWLQSRATGPAQEMEFSALPPAVQRRVIQLQLMRLKEPLDFELLERLRASANQSVSAGPQRFLVRREDGRVCLEPRKAVKFDRRSLEVDLSKNKGEAQFHDHRFRWRISRKAGKQFSGRENVEYFDCDKVGGTICLRCWNAGDRFQPAGMPKPVKVQDLFVNLKVPSAQRRARIVATTSTGELFWVEGLRISERFKLEERTVRRLKWSWRATRPLGPRKNRFGGLGVVRTK